MTNKELFELVTRAFNKNWKISKDFLGIYLYLNELGSKENFDVSIVKFDKETIEVRLTYYFRADCGCHISKIFDNREELVSYLNKINRIDIKNIGEVRCSVEEMVYNYFSALVK